MSNFREKFNAHLPIVLQSLGTASLIVIAISAICGTKSLKKLAESHVATPGMNHEIHNIHSSNK